MKHSGLGVASFVLGLSSILSFFATFLALSLTFVTAFSSDAFKTMGENAFDGMFGLLFLMILTALLAFLGLIFGIIGLVQKKKKSFCRHRNDHQRIDPCICPPVIVVLTPCLARNKEEWCLF